MSSNNGQNNASKNDLDVVDGALTELKKQYDSLVDEIKTKHDEQQKLFLDMAEKEYDGDDYEKDRINQLIDTNVANLKQQRDNIWKYLSQKYNQHTQQTYSNFKTLKSNETQINSNQARKLTLKQSLDDLTSKNETQKKLIQNNLYQHKTMYNKTYIQFIITIALITCIIILYLTSIDIVDDMVGYGAVSVIGLITVLYYIYRMYIYRMNRDKQYWHKIYFRRVDDSNDVPVNNVPKEDSIDYGKLDADAKTAFSQYKNSSQRTNSCQSSNVSIVN